MYDNYIAVDWAQANMAIARLSRISDKAHVIDVPASVDDLKDYLRLRTGTKILAIEETTTSQWLYVELREFVDKIVICDPRRNKLLSEGAKNDKIDAIKLARLLRADLLKPVFHSCDALIEVRKLSSAYDDLVQRGVRLKNQRSAVLRSLGKGKDEVVTEGIESFVVKKIDAAISNYEVDKKEYDVEFLVHIKKSQMLKNLKTIPGIGTIGAIKIGSIVVDANRFTERNKFLSYCGLVKLQKESGGRNYGSKAARCNLQMKSVFKTAALATIRGSGEFAKLYEQLITVERYPDHRARHAIARKIAVSALGTMKSGKKFNPNKIGALKKLIDTAQK